MASEIVDALCAANALAGKIDDVEKFPASTGKEQEQGDLLINSSQPSSSSEQMELFETSNAITPRIATDSDIDLELAVAEVSKDPIDFDAISHTTSDTEQSVNETGIAVGTSENVLEMSDSLLPDSVGSPTNKMLLEDLPIVPSEESTESSCTSEVAAVTAVDADSVNRVSDDISADIDSENVIPTELSKSASSSIPDDSNHVPVLETINESCSSKTLNEEANKPHAVDGGSEDVLLIDTLDEVAINVSKVSEMELDRVESEVMSSASSSLLPEAVQMEDEFPAAEESVQVLTSVVENDAEVPTITDKPLEDSSSPGDTAENVIKSGADNPEILELISDGARSKLSVESSAVETGTMVPVVTTDEANNILPQDEAVDDVNKPGNDGQDARSKVPDESLDTISLEDTTEENNEGQEVSELLDNSASSKASAEPSVLEADTLAPVIVDELGKDTSCAEAARMEVTEIGDDDEEMQDFLDVSATVKDKDLEDPMTVDTSEELMEVTSQADEDPIGLGDEPDISTVLNDEPMDVDDSSDKEKSVNISEDDQTAEEAPLAEASTSTDTADILHTEQDTRQEETTVDASVDAVDADVEPTDVTSTLIETSTDTADLADKSADTADDTTTDIVAPADARNAEVPVESNPLAIDATDDVDEEICIIPDTFRVLPTAGAKPTHTNAKKVAEETSGGISMVNTASLLKDDKAKQTSVEEPTAVIVGRPQRQAAKRAETQIKALAEASKHDVKKDAASKESSQSDTVVAMNPSVQSCFQCCRVTLCRFEVTVDGMRKFICEKDCSNLYQSERGNKTAESASVCLSTEEFTRKCGQCLVVVLGEEKNLSWETMDFCNEECLTKYQTTLGSFCANCKGAVASTSMGKYCVRFGYFIRQFCCSTCLEEFKKGLKVCSYCQLDISNNTEGFLAPVGDKGQFKDFCSQKCMEKYDIMSNNEPPPTVIHECDVCNNKKVVQVRVLVGKKKHLLCSDPCFAAFKFVNKVDSAEQCEMCKKYVDKKTNEMSNVFYNDAVHSFCSKMCMNVYVLANRKIVPCNWCKVKKYNFDMIRRVTASGQAIMMCSLSCLTLYQVSMNAVSSRKVKCDHCKKINQAQYHLTMSDATIRNFCAYNCVMSFQGQYSKNPPLTLPPGTDTPVIPTGAPKRTIYPRRSLPQNENQGNAPSTNSMPVITSVQSLAPNGQQAGTSRLAAALKNMNGPLVAQTNNANLQPPKPPQVIYKQQVIVKPPEPKEKRNKSVSCRPIMVNKSVSCKPMQGNKETQTDETIGLPIFIPIPVPIYVPAPMHMYSMPLPMPVPFPLPIPVPMFIPTTRNSISGILKELKRIQEKIPNDPFEAELLMMAEMVAGEKKGTNSDSDSDDGDNGAGDVSEVPEASSVTEAFSPEAVDTSNFGEDMLQMALKMASELEEPAVDLEATLTPSTITAQSGTSIEPSDATESDVDDPEPVMPVERSTRGRKRGAAAQRRGSMGSPSKRGRRVSSSGGDTPLLPPPEPTPPLRVEVEKPDANMCLKYTLGVSAWRHWVNLKNSELEKASNSRKLKLFKPEILQLTSDELNYSLCLFVKEVRKPNGTEYAPDTIYYLVLGIQQYLFENNRIDNIFTDAYYEKFTECLDEVAKKFSMLFSDQKYIVTRVEEEHLWESKQLGAHSPHVLLSTLMFFNTKHFNLTTVDEHMQLSFSHIMKHWKRNPNQPGATKVPGSRNVLLRFYPPQASLEANSRKKKVYEQQENEENPLRCPVKLYEFYLSKCPESVKTRNDVFYLLPERSCVPDSPVWYSTMALGKDPLVKMLHRVKMVKEINMALLTT